MKIPVEPEYDRLADTIRHLISELPQHSAACPVGGDVVGIPMCCSVSTLLHSIRVCAEEIAPRLVITPKPLMAIPAVSRARFQALAEKANWLANEALYLVTGDGFPERQCRQMAREVQDLAARVPPDALPDPTGDVWAPCSGCGAIEGMHAGVCPRPYAAASGKEPR